MRQDFYVLKIFFNKVLLKIYPSPSLPLGHVVMLSGRSVPCQFLLGSAEGLFSLFFCRLEHENGIVDLQGRPQFDTEYFNYVGLVQEQKGFTIYLLEVQNTTSDKNYHEDTGRVLTSACSVKQCT